MRRAPTPDARPWAAIIVTHVKARGCLIALAVGLGLLAMVAALVGPTLVREGGRIYAPIAKMQGAQQDFEAWSREQAFKEPAAVALTAEQLDRFLKLRHRLDAVDEANPLQVEGMRKKNERPNLSEIQGLLEGVGGAVTGRMAAYREAGMPPDEYRYLERVIYRLWLRPLRLKGLDPASVSRVASELESLSAAEKDAAVANRLKRLARTISAQRLPAPEGFDAGIHSLLLARATEIDALIDAGSSRPGGRNRVDF
jgi:hypothetical protein